MGDHIRHAIDSAIESRVEPQTPDVRVEFESGRDPPSGVMKVWHAGEDYRAELRYLRRPDSSDPMDNPWHVKVLGPDPLSGGRIAPLWSHSYDDRDSAESKAVEKLRRESRGSTPKVKAHSGSEFCMDHGDAVMLERAVSNLNISDLPLQQRRAVESFRRELFEGDEQ